jgi:hypothetical protein
MASVSSFGKTSDVELLFLAAASGLILVSTAS